MLLRKTQISFHRYFEPVIHHVNAFAHLEKYWLDTATIVACNLYNGSYSVGFDYGNGRPAMGTQSTALNTGALISKTSFNPSQLGTCILPGSAGCELDPTSIATLSYRGILDAFQHVITGSIYYTESSIPPLLNSDKTNIVLPGMPELSFPTGTSSASLKEKI